MPCSPARPRPDIRVQNAVTVVEDPGLERAQAEFERALAGSDPARLQAATDALADLLDEHDRGDDAREVYRAAGAAQRRLELGPALTSENPVARSRAWWTLGAELEHQYRDAVGAVQAYRNALAAAGEPDVVLAAAMNLGGLLAASGDRPGARHVYAQALAVAELLERSLPAEDPLGALVPVVAMKLDELDHPDDSG